VYYNKNCQISISYGDGIKNVTDDELTK